MAQSINRLVDRLGSRELRLDFASVEYMQSSVLGKLVALAKKVASVGGRMVLCNINDDVYKAFSVTSLDRMFTIERPPAVK
jgi:anti-anti-sigma factor